MEASDRRPEYALVRKLRGLANKVGASLSDATKSDYLKKYQRLTVSGKLPEHYNTKRAYYAYRAALLYGTALTTLEALKARDKATYGSPAWQEAMSGLKRCAAIYDRYPPDPNRQHHAQPSNSFQWKAVKAHKIKTIVGWSGVVASKKRLLPKLAKIPDWPSRIFNEVTDKHKAALAICALTGARPSEIARGVEIELVRKGATPFLRLRIKGSKVTEHSGQPERMLIVTIDSDAARYLVQCAESGHSTITTHPANLCAATIKAGRKAFPNLKESVTPYVFRHHLASQMKAAGIARKIIAQMLGHRATESQQAYGYAVSAKGEKSPLVATKASIPVRLTYRDPQLWLNQLSPTLAP